MKLVPMGSHPSTVPVTYARPLNDWERWLQDKFPVVARVLPDEPAILHGDSKALHVLLALVEDECPKIRHRSTRSTMLRSPTAPAWQPTKIQPSAACLPPRTLTATP